MCGKKFRVATPSANEQRNRKQSRTQFVFQIEMHAACVGRIILHAKLGTARTERSRLSE